MWHPPVSVELGSVFGRDVNSARHPGGVPDAHVGGDVGLVLGREGNLSGLPSGFENGQDIVSTHARDPIHSQKTQKAMNPIAHSGAMTKVIMVSLSVSDTFRSLAGK